MYYYKTAYGSPEAAKVKAAGAKWNGNWKVWESENDIQGIPKAEPDHQLVYQNAHPRFNPKSAAAVQFTQAVILLQGESIPDNKLEEILEHFSGGTYEEKCCIKAMELFMAVMTAGASPRGFWGKSATDIEKDIDATLA